MSMYKPCGGDWWLMILDDFVRLVCIDGLITREKSNPFLGMSQVGYHAIGGPPDVWRFFSKHLSSQKGCQWFIADSALWIRAKGGSYVNVDGWKETKKMKQHFQKLNSYPPWNLTEPLKIPSWELTYPLKNPFWRWFSFSPGGIC